MARNKAFPSYRQVTATEMTQALANDVETLAVPTQEAIRERAFQIYLARGSRPGSESEDWVVAEQELKTALPRPRKA